MHRTVQGTAIVNAIEPSMPGVSRAAVTAGLRLAALAVALSGSLASAQSPRWTSYSIPETGASVDFPSSVFTEVAGKADGYGQRFRTSDGRADLTIQSFPNDGNGSPAAFLEKRNPPAHIVYKRITTNFFVVSSFKGDKIWYDRCNFSSRFINCVLLNYPANEKRQWDGIVTRISNTLAGS
jgi:hypothetical protein